jgi:DNA-binding CsgD family transcriptional regulator
LDTTVSDRAAIVVVGGESGVGKTRLVSEFVDRARQRGATVLIGGCSDFGENGPSYWAVLEALRPVWSQIGSGEPAAALPEMPTGSVTNGGGGHQLSAGGTGGALGPAGSADQPAPGSIPLFELILRVLRRLAEPAPVVLVIEDVHWADRSTRDLLTFLLANLNQDRVMVIVTYRSEALGRRHSWQPLLAELRRNRRAEFIELPPFTRPELVAKLHGILGRPPEDALVELTWARSDGNAFFAEELVAAVADGYGNELPPTLRHILMCRVDALPEGAKRLLRLVAVAGDGVTYPLLAEVSGQSDADLVDSLRDCVEHQLLVVGSHDRTYRFRHSLMQEVLYQELLPGEKHVFHGAFGRALSREVGRPNSVGSARLAYHWYAAGDSEKALAAAIDAATAAASIYGFAEAQSQYERAIELWDQVDDASAVVGLSRADLFERAAEVAHLAGEHRRAAGLIGAALADPIDGDRHRAVRLQRLGRYLWAAGDSRDALKSYEEALRCLPPGVASAERAGVEGSYAEALMLSGRFRSSRDHAEAALEVAREAGALLEEAQILATLGFDLAFLGDSDSGVLALERAQVIADDLGNPDDIGRSYLKRAELLSGPLNRLAEAAEIAERGVERVRQLGLERTYGVALQAIAVNTLFRLGRWSEADRFLQSALAAKPTGTAAIDLCLARAKLSVGRGQFEAAESDLRAVEALAAGGLGPRYQAPLLTLRAGLDLWLGRAEQVRDAVSRGIIASITGSDDFWLLAPLIWHGLRAEADLADRARGRRDGAALEKAIAIAAGLSAQVHNLAADSHDAAPSLRQAVDAYVCLCRGEVARAEGRPDPEVWADAARRWSDLQQPYPSAYASWREAEALLAQRSRSARASEALRAAYQVAVALGATPFRREVEALAQRARLPLELPVTLPDGPSITVSGARSAERGAAPFVASGAVLARQAAKARYGLSARELEVWLLLPDGLTNNQVGERLFISGKTASVHVTNILRKLDVRTRVQAIGLAHQLGVVDSDRSEEL